MLIFAIAVVTSCAFAFGVLVLRGSVERESALRRAEADAKATEGWRQCTIKRNFQSAECNQALDEFEAAIQELLFERHADLLLAIKRLSADSISRSSSPLAIEQVEVRKSKLIEATDAAFSSLKEHHE